MTHAASKSRHAAPKPSRYSRGEKTIGFVLLAIVIFGVAVIWITSLTHGTTVPVTHAVHHILTHPAVHHTAAHKAVSSSAKAAAAKAAAGAAASALGVHVAIKHYTVKAGDTLWGIAKVKLHNPLLWRKLYALNLHVIGSNPNAIVAGQSLLL
jgi:LysM domain